MEWWTESEFWRHFAFCLMNCLTTNIKESRIVEVLQALDVLPRLQMESMSCHYGVEKCPMSGGVLLWGG